MPQCKPRRSVLRMCRHFEPEPSTGRDPKDAVARLYPVRFRVIDAEEWNLSMRGARRVTGRETSARPSSSWKKERSTVVDAHCEPSSTACFPFHATSPSERQFTRERGNARYAHSGAFGASNRGTQGEREPVQRSAVTALFRQSPADPSDDWHRRGQTHPTRGLRCQKLMHSTTFGQTGSTVR